ncbi:response regulator [bacterium]|nr:response regulator [bacterium]
MKKLNIFIVDDDQDVAESLALVLEGRGHHVECAYSGEQALEIYSAKKFDITFLDVKLPGMNGVECFQKIRSVQADARVVMITGYSVESLLEQVRDEGAWDIMFKPLNIKKIIEMLGRLKSLTLLLVDDDPDFIESMQIALATTEIRIKTASTGNEAIEWIEQNGIDILVLDVRLPDMDGLETYKRLMERGYKLPTVIITAYAAAEASKLDQLKTWSQAQILAKPFDPNDLLTIVQRLAENCED